MNRHDGKKHHDGEKREHKSNENAVDKQLQSFEARLAVVEKAAAQTQSIAARLNALERQQAEMLTLLRAAVKPDSRNRELARVDHGNYFYQASESKSDDQDDEDRD